MRQPSLLLFAVIVVAVVEGTVIAPLRSSLFRNKENHRAFHARRSAGVGCADPLAKVAFVKACLNVSMYSYEEVGCPGQVDVFLDRSAPVDLRVTLGVAPGSNASDLLDYHRLQMWQIIPAGSSNVSFFFYPVDDGDDVPSVVVLNLFVESVVAVQDASFVAQRCPDIETLPFVKHDVPDQGPRSSRKRLPPAAFWTALQSIYAALAPLTQIVPPPVTVVNFFDVCQNGADCDFMNHTTVVQISLPVSPVDAAKAFGIIRVGGGSTLLISDEADTAGSSYTLRVKSLLIEGLGTFQAGTPEMPFGSKSGSTFTLALYGSNDFSNLVTCAQPFCGVPRMLWESAPCLYPNPSLSQSVRNVTFRSCQQASGNPYLADMDYFYPYRALDKETLSTNYFGRKVLAVAWAGTLSLHGAWGNNGAASVGSGASWARANPVDSGSMKTVTVDNANQFANRPWILPPSERSFRAMLTSTDWLATHSEVISVKASPNAPGTFVAESIRFPHLGEVKTLAANVAPTIVKRSGDFRAAFGFIDRSITIIAEGSSPGSPLSDGFGGHVILRQGFRSAQVSGVLLEKLGQGGLKGRYPFHWHLCRRTANGAVIRDSTVYDSNTRFVTIHGTHNVTVTRVVGLECMGHGMYLEDGVEILNRIEYNVFAFAKSGFLNTPSTPYAHNNRSVSGIFAWPGPDKFPFPAPNCNDYGQCTPLKKQWLSDALTPTLVWIRNPYNYINYNLAVGAEASGVAYWFVSNPVNGGSAEMNWNNTMVYAYVQQNVLQQQTTQSLPSGSRIIRGTPPTLEFVGNSGAACSSLIQTVWDYGTNALTAAWPQRYPNTDIAASVTFTYTTLQFNTLYDYAAENGFPLDTRVGYDGLDSNVVGCPLDASSTLECNGECGIPTMSCDGSNPACSVETSGGCGGVYDISEFTGSFGFSETNFATIWLRTQFFLVRDLWLADVVGGGVNFANNGDSTGITDGYWGLLHRSVFLGISQTQSAFADFRGPVTPENGARCAKTQYGNGNARIPADMCVLPAEGFACSYNNFGTSQHFLHIYDGPMGVYSAHFENITANIVSCPSNAIDIANDDGAVSPWCQIGLPRESLDSVKCVNPNAALGWKSPNGFSYPPAYRLEDLTFANVDIRHHVYLPQFLSGTFDTDIVSTKGLFCQIPPPAEPTPPPYPEPTAFCPPCTQEQCMRISNIGANNFVCFENSTFYNFGANPFSGPYLSGGGCAPPGPCCGQQTDTMQCCLLQPCWTNPNPQPYVNLPQWSSNWNSIDRQTNLKDLDGSLTNRKTTDGQPTFVINNDEFFRGPSTEVECQSLNTSYVLPHHFGHMSIRVGNWTIRESCRTNSATDQCKIVRLHRLSYEVSPSELPVPPLIPGGPLGGMGLLYMEGTQYLLELLLQPVSGIPKSDTFDPAQFDRLLVPSNSWAGQEYLVQIEYPSRTQQPVSFIVFVGTTNFIEENDVSFCQMLKAAPFIPSPNGPCIPKSQWASQTGDLSFVSSFISSTYLDGYLNVTIDYRAVPNQRWVDGSRERCVPGTLCKFNLTSSTCQCKNPPSSFKNPLDYQDCVQVCERSGGEANLECPGGGCLGFTFRLPAGVYQPPFGNNATQYLEGDKSLTRQWSPIILNSKFVGPTPSVGLC